MFEGMALFRRNVARDSYQGSYQGRLRGTTSEVLGKVLGKWCLEPAQPAGRPYTQEGLPNDVLLRDGADDAGVGRVSPVVSHDENVSVWHPNRAVGAFIRQLGIEVRLFPAL